MESRELILLVDDEAEIAELASAMLTEEGYKVILARDGFEALRIYQQISKQIGLVILDFFLPVMDGDAVFDELRAESGRRSGLEQRFCRAEQVGQHARAGLARIHSQAVYARKTARTSSLHARRRARDSAR